jgi:ParB/Sulfiredoxin domain
MANIVNLLFLLYRGHNCHCQQQRIFDMQYSVDTKACISQTAKTQVIEDLGAVPGNRKLEMMPIDRIVPSKRNARTHSQRQIRQIAESIRRFGFTNPVLIDDCGEILAGHGRVAAAKLLGLRSVPILRLSHLSPAEKRAYVLADNKLADNAGWDREILAVELQELIGLNFDVELTGFEMTEVDISLDVSDKLKPDHARDPRCGRAVSQPGDVWMLGNHRLVCGDPPGEADVLVKRWQSSTRKSATLAATGHTYKEVETLRAHMTAVEVQ